jgi:hypothetical protein
MHVSRDAVRFHHSRVRFFVLGDTSTAPAMIPGAKNVVTMLLLASRSNDRS